MNPDKLDKLGTDLQKSGKGIFKGCLSMVIVVIAIAIAIAIATMCTSADKKENVSESSVVASDSSAMTMDNSTDYKNIGDTLSVGKILYKVIGFKYMKEIGEHKSNGIYLVVELKYKNISNSEINIQNEFFSVIDNAGKVYETDSEIASENEKTICFTKCNPNITKLGFVVFEVPNKDSYVISLFDNAEGDNGIGFVSLPLEKEHKTKKNKS